MCGVWASWLRCEKLLSHATCHHLALIHATLHAQHAAEKQLEHSMACCKTCRDSIHCASWLQPTQHQEVGITTAEPVNPPACDTHTTAHPQQVDPPHAADDIRQMMYQHCCHGMPGKHYCTHIYVHMVGYYVDQSLVLTITFVAHHTGKYDEIRNLLHTVCHVVVAHNSHCGTHTRTRTHTHRVPCQTLTPYWTPAATHC